MSTCEDFAAGGVSVMMPAYNAERYLEDAIGSVLAQTFTKWELIVVDDGSSDRTSEIARNCRDARVRVISQHNRGEAAARNRALDHARGEFLAFLDADDMYLPHHLSTVVRYLDANPGHAGVYTDGYHVTATGRHLSRLSTRRRGPFTGRVFDELVRGSDVFGPPLCVTLRLSAVRRHDLRFDEEIVIGPDWDFFVRISDVGTFGYVDEATCLYRVHDSNITSRTGNSARTHDLAKCRIKAITMPNFTHCPPDVRKAVLYELLVNLLRGNPARQREMLGTEAFLGLPRRDQARLLRLMASKSILFGDDPQTARLWLRRSREANRFEFRSAALLVLHGISPQLCRLALRVRTGGEPDPLTISSFADLDERQPECPRRP